MPEIIDGKAFAARLLDEIAADVAALPFTPGLAVVLVGDDPASKVYVANKTRQTVQVGMKSFEHRLPAAKYAHGGAGRSRTASSSFLKKRTKKLLLNAGICPVVANTLRK